MKENALFALSLFSLIFGKIYIHMVAEEKTIETPEENAYEQERGKPMPSLDHSLIQLRLGFLLMRGYEDEFTFASEISLKLSEKGTTPDLCIFPKMNRVIGDQPDIIKMEEAPLTTIEILSPTQALGDLTNKLKGEYFPNGVKSAWVILPELRAVAIFENGKDGYEYYKEGELHDPVTDIKLKVDEVFKV